MQVTIIGCGGDGGSNLINSLVPRIVKPGDVTGVDGDIYEKKNLDRQRFDEKFIGINKADAMAEMYGINPVAEYFHVDLLDFDQSEWIFCEVDNNPARRAVLSACDQFGCSAIITANEVTDVESYVYRPEWKDTPNDPRVFYPSILTDASNDPMGPPGCIEAAMTGSRPNGPHLAYLGNAMAIALFMFYTRTKKDLSRETKDSWPVHLKWSKWGPKSITLGHKLDQAGAA